MKIPTPSQIMREVERVADIPAIRAIAQADAIMQNGHAERMQAFHDAVLTAAKEARRTGKPVVVGRMLDCPIIVQPPETQE